MPRAKIAIDQKLLALLDRGRRALLVIEEPELERLVTTLVVVTGFDTELRRRVPEAR